MKFSKKVRELLRNGKTLKLDIGCGLRKKEGYIGIDIIDYSDQYKNGEFIQCDITEGIPLPDNCVEYVYSNRFFEHVPFHYRTKIRKRPYDPLIYILEEIHRVSINKAIVEIIVPTNPEESPFHTRRFGIYSLDEFTDKSKKTFIVSKKKFRLVSAKFIFAKGLNPFNYLGHLMNLLYLREKITWSFLRYFFVPTEIQFILEVEK